MPNGIQEDIQDSIWVCRQLLGIEYEIINIQGAYESLLYHIGFPAHASVPNIIKTNMPARLRMTTLYAVAGLFSNARVINTCNRSEDYVGYSTKYGDATGDISPLGNLTVREVLEIGDDLGLPHYLVHKPPSDGMCGKTDEDNLGFTYEQLDNYIEGKVSLVPDDAVDKIEYLHRTTRHKYELIPTFGKGDF
jgi:NAD+ synthase